MTTLGDLAAEGVLKFSDGYRTKQSEHAEAGFRILRAGDVNGGTIHPLGSDFVASDYATAIGDKVSRAGDVVLTTKGTVGRVAYVEHVSEPVVYSPQVCFFRTQDSLALNQRFFGYWLQGPEFTGQASYLMGASDMAPYISLRDLSRTTITLPTVADQQAIAEVLGALDDKIAANARVVEGADRLAVTRFDAAPKLDLRPLSRLADFVNGRAYTQGPTGTGRVVIRIAELNSGIGGSTVYNDLDVPEENLARPGDLLFAWSGSLTVRRWFRSEGIVNQHIFKVIPRDGYPLWLVAAVLQRKLADFQAIAADKATTMGHIQRRHLDEPVAIPSAAEIRGLDRLMAALWHKALAAERESLHLAQLRDTLLPHLMSGRMSVRQAEHTVSNAL